uniref:Secreted protein n=1 Tax=Amblyomma triste TaxID=251400 RepID=A0A023FZS2_AMBTT
MLIHFLLQLFLATLISGSKFHTSVVFIFLNKSFLTASFVTSSIVIFINITDFVASPTLSIVDSSPAFTDEKCLACFQ